MRLSPTAVATTMVVLAVILVGYVFGPPSILRALAWSVLGAFVGWLGSLALRSDTQAGILLDILAGIVGGLCGLLVFGGGSLTEGGPVERVLSAILGSVVAIAAGGLIRRRSRRSISEHQ